MQWFVKYEDRISQALSLARLRKIYHAGYITDRTWVRSNAMADWKQILEVPGLVEVLQ